VSETDNLKVWDALHRLIERVDLGMRMELIAHLLPPLDAPPEILDAFYSIYDQYKDDQTIRDESTSEKFSGPGAGFPHRKIEVRDFIHMHWARWLKLKQKLKSPDKNASPAMWETYRAAVAREIERSRSKKRQ